MCKQPSLLVGNMWWLVVLLAGLALLIYNMRILSRDGRKLPPLRDGWLPWLGCAMEMRKEPLRFVENTRNKVSSRSLRTQILFTVS